MFSKLSKTIFNLILSFFVCSSRKASIDVQYIQAHSRRHQKQIKPEESEKEEKFLCIFNFHFAINKLNRCNDFLLSQLAVWGVGVIYKSMYVRMYEKFARNIYALEEKMWGGHDDGKEGEVDLFVACLMPFRIEHLQYMCAVCMQRWDGYGGIHGIHAKAIRDCSS